ncbi:anthranilate synthase family protein [Paenarthrobacter sp. NPDC092416]|uniref:anthranilate synthase family protein n=1 Tax=Paenarthrobacter sp. NPDC092416 TaxID=3364386 RepID=UPI003816C032
MTSLLARIIASSSGDAPLPFAVIRRNGSDDVDVITGPIIDIENLAEIPLESGPNAHDVLVLVPYRQLKERGYTAQDDGTPLRCLIVTERETVSAREVLEILPRFEVPTDSLGFDTPDDHYAETVRRVINDEIGQGEGANFVIRRSFRATTSTAPAAAVLSWLRTLLATEQGAYWTFAVHTPGHSLVGATPERHVSVKSGLVTMNPISGTFRHPIGGPTRAGALRFLADTKETEELFMVVDEEMKMMSAVCPDGGRILGPYLKQMSKLSHTEYLLEGRTELDPREVLRATMFAPTVTGSPMENACAVIDRYEEGGRGYYSGVLAFFESEASGNDSYSLDAPILIRAAHIDSKGLIKVSAGATLVRMSTPEGEVEETRTKAAGVLSALGLIPKDPVPDAVDLNKQPGVTAALETRNEKLASFWTDSQGANTNPPFAQRTALVIDCGDQFTQMLAHQLRYLGMTTSVTRWDSVSDLSSFDLVVFGPGPGDPRQGDARITTVGELMRARLSSGKALLAVCLSHQILSLLAGLRVEALPSPHQGVRLEVDVFGARAAIGFYNTFSAVRAAGQVSTPELGLEISAEETVVSALRGDGVASIQGHLESVLSTDGLTTLERLIRMAFETAPRREPAMNRLG